MPRRCRRRASSHTEAPSSANQANRSRSADLQQQLVVRVLAHRPVEELDHRAMSLQFLDEQHLMHIVARQAVWRGDQDAVQPGARGGIAQSVQAGAPEAGTAVAVVTEDVFLHQLPAASRSMVAQAVKLLLNGLRLSLTPARN